MVKLQQLLVIVAVAMAMTSANAQDVAAEDLHQDLLDESDSGDGSGYLGGSFAVDTSTIDSDSAAGEVTTQPETPAPSPTSPSVVQMQPVVDGVKMFGQCGGVFYSGSTTCADPDAYCKELSIYSSICSPKPVK